jgi:hypothetical protein
LLFGFFLKKEGEEKKRLQAVHTKQKGYTKSMTSQKARSGKSANKKKLEISLSITHFRHFLYNCQMV